MSQLTVRDCLNSYRLDRELTVLAPNRLLAACDQLEGLGDYGAADRAALAQAVTHHIARRRAQGRRDGTIRRELIVLRAALRHAWKSGHLSEQPYVVVPPTSISRQRFLTREEARTLVSATRPDDILYLFVALALITGARVSAILELSWDRVDQRRSVIDFRVPGQSSRRKHRAVVPLSGDLVAILAAARADRQPRPEDRVIPLGLSAISRRLRRTAASVDLVDVSPHVLRHTVATWLLSGPGVSLLTASRLLGHRSTLITEQVYTHLTARDLVPAVDILSAALWPID